MNKKQQLAAVIKAALAENAVNEQAAPANQLADALKGVLADAFVFYFKAQTFHWNVEGPHFPQYHEFFSTVYTTAYGSIDKLAEEIRALGVYAPHSLADLMSATSLSEATVAAKPAKLMLSELASDNAKIIGGLTNAYAVAEAAKEIGLSNFLQDLIDGHKKLGWMIASTAKE